METLPPITDNFSRYSTNMYMTGKLGLLSSPQKPRPPKVAVSPPNYCNSECDMSKARQKTTSKHVSPEEFHTTSHSQHQGGTSHRSVNRSGSHDPKPTRPPHKRSSSISETPCFVQGPSKPPPGSEMRPVKAKPAESRQTWSQDMWTGTGFDLIGHRQPFNPSVSRKKESTYSVRAPDGHCALAQSALNDSTAHQLQLAQQETLSSSNFRDKTTQRFDGSPAWSRRYDTERRTSHLCNDNNNSNAGGSPPRVPCSSSNEENPQSYQLSTTTYQGLSGGGGRHSKYKQYAANGSVGNNIQLDSLYSPRGSRGSSRTSTPHKVRVCIVYFTVSLKCMLMSLCPRTCSVQYTHDAHKNTTNLIKPLMCTYLHVRMRLVSFPSLPSSPPPLLSSPPPLLLLESPVVEVVCVASETLGTL